MTCLENIIVISTLFIVLITIQATKAEGKLYATEYCYRFRASIAIGAIKPFHVARPERVVQYIDVCSGMKCFHTIHIHDGKLFICEAFFM